MTDFSPFPEPFGASDEPQKSTAEPKPVSEEMPTPPGPAAEEPVSPPSLDQETVFTSGEVIPPMPESSIPSAPPVTPPPAPAKKSNKTIWIILAVVLILICVCCVIAVVVSLSSPDFQNILEDFSYTTLGLL